MATTSAPKFYRDNRASNVRTLRVDRIDHAHADCTVVRVEHDGVITHPNRPTRMTLRRLTGPAFVPLDSAAEATEGTQ